MTEKDENIVNEELTEESMDETKSYLPIKRIRNAGTLFIRIQAMKIK